jgi:ATP sulfurylase
VARSSAKAEYRAMASTTSELIWIKQLLKDLEIKVETSMEMYCNNQAAKHITLNSIFHEITKHIDINCHFIREKIQSNEIETPFVKSENQLVDVFTKGLDPGPFHENVDKLGMFNIYIPNLS